MKPPKGKRGRRGASDLDPAIIVNPDFPIRAGVSASSTAVLVLVALLCTFQYWLLTATLEAHHTGDTSLPLGAFFASLGCFAFAVVLTIANEIAILRQHDFLRKTRPIRGATSTIVSEHTRPAPARPEASPAKRVASNADAAGGGDHG